MCHLLRCALTLALLFPATQVMAAPAASPRTFSGQLQRAPWRLDVPADWNGDLVMLAHGYEPVGMPRATPMPANDGTAPLLAAGYAVAQSAYASQGWAVADAITDMERLRRHAVAELKHVRHIWMLGFSMGGAVTLASLERFPQHYAGGVSLCGANLSGEQIASDLLTTLVAFDYFFAKAEGLPGAGLLSPEAAALPQGELYQGISNALQRSPSHAALLAQRLQVSADALAGTISLHALVLHELATRSGGMPVGNRGVAYSGFGDDMAFNAGVQRVDAVPAAQAAVRRELALSGALRRPLVIQFNNNDPTIVPRMQTVYPQTAARAGARPLPQVLPPVGEGHCGFSGAQIIEALKAAQR
ncbi:hypothetical protein JY412_09305 [Stenotrophomonas maltophilia]|uniref:alpha/beta hydrolase family protein n=1 Tax=Stenotrophomonas TaxID=40323 RepID=UPI00038FA926|nr:MULTISPECIES: hypothetical protein [Stenotrophomonas]EQM76038.1 hypothetical protein L681_17420 [Stenotrophomonas maltophilia MF89]ELK2665208.1 hypothetical protein [Stenotrophomonas maltophilia]KUJ03131.1 hypothetical protein AR275_07165 [Stenotrophomonas maltophilia]MBA0329055.1 hypothetical protein [Stenotrophomonas maltophilia]MBH1375452.1 hypothetical protein [Stenotrophomonas maltophilia]